MVSSSSSPPSPSVPASSSRSWRYDVFLSFRGKDTRKTFVENLYSALVERVTCTYKDDETLPRGDTIGPSLLKAIEESQIAIIIFSENYANSSWCLDELEYIMKCREERGQIVIPIFYHVEPTDVRKQKRKYEEAFAKHESENNKSKVESWRKALVAVGNIAGWEINHNVNSYEAKCIKDIVSTISDRLLYSKSVVDENLVGMETRLQDLKSQLEIGSGGVRMIGIWGIGGGGKTTLASSLYIEMSTKFYCSRFLGNIKDESSKPNGMEILQGKILSTVLKIEVKVESIDIGKHMIKSRLGHKKVLILLDDVDECKQLEALAGSHNWFGDGSRIIITTRDKHLLITHRVDKVSHVSLLSNAEAIRLFNRSAYNENNPIEDYKWLSRRVVSYARGLPLALKVLGSFLYDKNKDEWISTMDRLKDIPEMEVVEKLKISYDGLKPLEKELFLDIVCFFRGKKKDDAMEMFDACGFHPVIGIKVLIQKALITIQHGKYFEMHDMVQEMRLYIVRGEYPNNPEKHSRLWRFKEIGELCCGNETTINENNKTEAIVIYFCPSGFGKFLSKAKKLRLLYVYNDNIDKGDIEVPEVPEYLSNELRYMFWHRYPANLFPESFQPRKLVVLRLKGSLQQELWWGNKYLPCLKEIHLSYCHLVRTPDLGGLSCLQKLTLEHCDNLKEIHPSLGNHTSLVSLYVNNCAKLKEFPTIVQMGKLEILDISNCQAPSKFQIEANMESLVHLSLIGVGIESLASTVGKYCTKLRSLNLKECSNLRSIEGNFRALKHLKKCEISGARELIMLPKDLFNVNICLEELHLFCTSQPSVFHLPRFLRKLSLNNSRLKDGEIPCDIGELSNLQELDLSFNDFSRLNISLSQLTLLKLLNLIWCWELVELPELPTSIAILKADRCESLEVVGDIHRNCKWLSQVSLRHGKRVIGGDRLLQTMLQGHPIENGCMSLQLDGYEIPKGFRPRLLKGSECRLELPENWYNHFSGFLFCAAMIGTFNWIRLISMKHEKGGSTKNMDSQHDVFWEEIVEDVATCVVYVSFGSLKDTYWWDSKSTYVEFSFEKGYRSESCSWFGVRLVSKTSHTTTTNSSSESPNDYTCNFRILRDSKSHLECGFGRQGEKSKHTYQPIVRQNSSPRLYPL